MNGLPKRPRIKEDEQADKGLEAGHRRRGGCGKGKRGGEELGVGWGKLASVPPSGRSLSMRGP